MKPGIRKLLFGGSGTGSGGGDFGLLLLRLGAGLMMATGHGLGKIWMNGHLGPSEQFVTGVAKMGFPAPTFFAWCSALAEFLAALLLAAGLVTRLASAMLVINMFVAGFIALRAAPIVSPTGGPSKEMAILYLLIFLCFAIIGAGRFSTDRLIRGSAKSS